MERRPFCEVKTPPFFSFFFWHILLFLRKWLIENEPTAPFCESPPPGAHFSTLDGAKGQVADFSTFGGPSAPGSTLAGLTQSRSLSSSYHPRATYCILELRVFSVCYTFLRQTHGSPSSTSSSTASARRCRPSAHRELRGTLTLSLTVGVAPPVRALRRFMQSCHVIPLLTAAAGVPFGEPVDALRNEKRSVALAHASARDTFPLDR